MRKFKVLKVILIVSLLFFLGQELLPVKVIGIHKPGTTSTVVVVKNFPITREGKIRWWEKNRLQLQQKFPFIGSPQNHRVLFFVSSYRKNHGTDEDSDLLCFKDMASEKNCISKENRPLVVWYNPDSSIEYETQYFFDPFLRRL